MRVAIDCRRILDGMSGLGMYTERLVSALAAAASDLDIELTAFVSRGSEHLVRHLENSIDLRFVPYRVEDHFRGDIWKHVTLPHLLNRMSIDVFHDPACQLPLTRSRARYVVTIHDLSPFRYPETNTLKYNLHWKFMIRRSAARADRIITVSQFVRREIDELFPGTGTRTDVVLEAAGPNFSPAPPDVGRLRALGITCRYLLTAAKYEPRKNLARCLEAFMRGPAAAIPDIQLVIAGEMGWKIGDVRRMLDSGDAGRRIVTTGYLLHDDLVNAVRGAEAVVVPSLYEGFGLPVIEAMACGTPVLCSNVAALPEVAGDAAVYFDPEDTAAIAEVMESVLADRERLERMRLAGLRRVGLFSWEKAARETADVYRKALES